MLRIFTKFFLKYKSYFFAIMAKNIPNYWHNDKIYFNMIKDKNKVILILYYNFNL